MRHGYRGSRVRCMSKQCLVWAVAATEFPFRIYIFLNLRCCCFSLPEAWLWVLFYLSMYLSNFLYRLNVIYSISLMYFFSNSNICVSSGLVLTEDSSLVMFSFFFAAWSPLLVCQTLWVLLCLNIFIFLLTIWYFYIPTNLLELCFWNAVSYSDVVCIQVLLL